jgi:hypothetical protein
MPLHTVLIRKSCFFSPWKIFLFFMSPSQSGMAPPTIFQIGRLLFSVNYPIGNTTPKLTFNRNFFNTAKIHLSPQFLKSFFKLPTKNRKWWANRFSLYTFLTSKRKYSSRQNTFPISKRTEHVSNIRTDPESHEFSIGFSPLKSIQASSLLKRYLVYSICYMLILLYQKTLNMNLAKTITVSQTRSASPLHFPQILFISP